LKKLQKEGVAEDIVKDAEEEVQKMTNNFSVKVDNLVKLRKKI
jgi:ribosome recycling factor